jgi:hypothetical protein
MGRREARAVVRLPLEERLFERIEEFRRAQVKIPSRTEAVRLLLWRALEWGRELELK